MIMIVCLVLQIPLLADIHDYMKKANEVGSISRQEAVSMVPPLFLDVQPHHKVKKGGGGIYARVEEQVIICLSLGEVLVHIMYKTHFTIAY